MGSAGDTKVIGQESVLNTLDVLVEIKVKIPSRLRDQLNEAARVEGRFARRLVRDAIELYLNQQPILQIEKRVL